MKKAILLILLIGFSIGYVYPESNSPPKQQKTELNQLIDQNLSMVDFDFQAIYFNADWEVLLPAELVNRLDIKTVISISKDALDNNRARENLPGKKCNKVLHNKAKNHGKDYSQLGYSMRE